MHHAYKWKEVILIRCSIVTNNSQEVLEILLQTYVEVSSVFKPKDQKMSHKHTTKLAAYLSTSNFNSTIDDNCSSIYVTSEVSFDLEELNGSPRIS